jgi:hypothetical protein
MIAPMDCAFWNLQTSKYSSEELSKSAITMIVEFPKLAMFIWCSGAVSRVSHW